VVDVNYYERLGVPPSATTAELRAAYRARVRLVHPDASRGSDEHMVAALNEAWRVLSDPARRSRYDESLRRPADRRQSIHEQLVASLKLAATAAAVVLVLLAFIALTQSG